MRLRTRAVALAIVASLAGPFVGASSVGAEPRFDLERLAQAQSKLWADGLVNGFDGPLSPPGCDYRQPPDDTRGLGPAVFMLPVNAGGGPPLDPSVTCRVKSHQWILADLGGLVPFEDDNGVAGGWTLANGKTVPFTPRTLEKICRDVMAREGAEVIVPFPATVTVDGRSVRSQVKQVITDPFTYRVPGNWLLDDDSEALGHPGTLAASYCGYKLLLPPLKVGKHVLVGLPSTAPSPGTFTSSASASGREPGALR
jgi:hypothetical protein